MDNKDSVTQICSSINKASIRDLLTKNNNHIND